MEEKEDKLRETGVKKPISGFEATPTDVNILEKFILANERWAHYGRKYIDLRIILTTALVLAMGISQKKQIEKLILYTTRFLTHQLNREQRRKFLTKTKKYFQHYHSLLDFKNYHFELMRQLGNTLLALQYKYILNVLISVAIGYVVGSTLMMLKAKYAYQILNESVDELHRLTKIRTSSNLPHKFLNKIEMSCKTKVFSSQNYQSYQKITYSKDSLKEMLLGFQSKEDMLTASRNFLIGNYYFDFATGKSFIGSKRAQLVNMMEDIADSLKIEWSGEAFTQISSE